MVVITDDDSIGVELLIGIVIVDDDDCVVTADIEVVAVDSDRGEVLLLDKIVIVGATIR